MTTYKPHIVIDNDGVWETCPECLPWADFNFLGVNGRVPIQKDDGWFKFVTCSMCNGKGLVPYISLHSKMSTD